MRDEEGLKGGERGKVREGSGSSVGWKEGWSDGRFMDFLTECCKEEKEEEMDFELIWISSA